MYMMKKIYSISLLILIAVNNLLSQQESSDRTGLYIAGGLSSSWFVGNDRMTFPFAPSLPLPDDADEFVPGPNYKGQFPGLGIRGMWVFDQARKFRASFGLDYHFYVSRDRELSEGLIIRKLNSHYIPAFTGAFDYAFINLPVAQAKIYGGLDVRGTFVVSNTYEEFIEYQFNSSLNRSLTRSKEGTFRLGGGAHLGVEGEIFDPWYVNLSIGWGIMNLVGRDDARGELLTPYPDEKYENKETRVYNIFANLFVQYRL